MLDQRNLGIIQNLAGLPNSFVTGKPMMILNSVLPYLFGIAGIILLLNIITSGLKMMTSQGDPKTLQAAQAKLTTSIIGILILFVSFWIVQLLFMFLGVTTPLFN